MPLRIRWAVSIPPEPPVVVRFEAGTARSAQGRAVFGAAQRNLAREHRSGTTPRTSTGGLAGWTPILLVSSELVFLPHAACLICSFLCSFRYSIFK
jgi:hypothetical protein